MKLSELMATSPETLAELQLNSLKKHVVKTLMHVVGMIENEDFEPLQRELIYSPAGDEMGTDSYHIDFCYDHKDKDLCDLLYLLSSLQEKVRK